MRHCDDYLDDPTQPKCLRRFLKFNRWPARWQLRAMAMGIQPPKLYATHKDRRVRVTMASRLGDVGISTYMLKEHGYQKRVAVEELREFSDKPSRRK